MDDAAIVMEAATRAGGQGVGVKLARLGTLVIVNFGGRAWEVTSATSVTAAAVEAKCAEVVAEGDTAALLDAEIALRDAARQKAELLAIAADTKVAAAVRTAATAAAAKL